MNARGEDGKKETGGRTDGTGDESLGRIVDLMPCYVVLLDTEHRILAWNAAFEKFFGPPGDKPCYAALR
jgi:PAS domain-containing protein